MAIPKHDEIRLRALDLLTKHPILKLKDFIEPLAEDFNLSEEEVTRMYPSGNGHIFYDRVSWALSYLNMAGLVDKPKRGQYQINPQGRQMLNSPEKLEKYIQKKLEKREPTRKKKEATTTDKLSIEKEDEDSTPQEKLYNSFENIRKSIYAEILDTILSKTPIEFERLVVQLLQKMGYGGEIKDSGMVTKASNDGGIDGVIKEDILGLGRIYLQAKRYKLDSGIQRDEVQKFVGALQTAQSNKGVFITTSYFSSGAIGYVESLHGSNNIVLVDGKKLAEFIYDFGLGMQVEQTIEIKKLDADYWDSMKDQD
ncbi:restriction endonuclease [Christiangramia flava]|uniref:Mrr restriction system protein n=1 Tax=Christiangramia flava JLT2011 TaxID=1229726 RepID=A0A1L7I0H7_9FLAO|nr:restriction endonuclease [Christiangramia flava]APU67090.1 Mrr restriction system protein [Christiangramia flava JLT2011]OSS38138.1 putative Mrr restriction system protein [Christiangramia flava JLT2011]